MSFDSNTFNTGAIPAAMVTYIHMILVGLVVWLTFKCGKIVITGLLGASFCVAVAFVSVIAFPANSVESYLQDAMSGQVAPFLVRLTRIAMSYM